MQHVKERPLHERPPAIEAPAFVHALKVGVFSKARQIFLGGFSKVPVVLSGKLGYLLPYGQFGMTVHIVEERVKLLAKQLSQSVVCHGFMQQCLLHIGH